MKKITKICAVVAACLAAIGLTGCPDVADSFGKDDFRGTWMTLDFDGNTPKTYYENTSNEGKYYSITWNFDGRSENMFNGNGGRFWQHLVNYGTDETLQNVENETFWFGQYAIKGNSGYSKGKLYLYYQCGIDIDEEIGLSTPNYKEKAREYFYHIAGIERSSSLESSGVNYNWTLEDFLNKAFGNTNGLANLNNETLCNLAYNGQNKNGSPAADDTTYYNGAYVNHHVTVQVRNQDGNMKCSDIEYFRFNLKDGSASGYTRMMATVLNQQSNQATIGGIYNQWVPEDYSGATVGDSIPTTVKKFNGGFKVKNGCSWSGQNTRFMGRISVTSTPENPTWLNSNTNDNDTLFKVGGKLVDSNDTTDYSDVDSNVSAEE